MPNAKYMIFVVGLLIAVAATACAPAAAPATQPPAPQPVEPAQQEPVAAVPAQPQTAPLCQGSSTCVAPDVTDIAPDSGYCTEKIPYHNILVPDGTTWEELDSSGDFKCFDQNTFVDGKRVIACTGKELWSYQLALTGPGCGASNLVTETAQCQQGYGFDAAQQCCAPLAGGGGGAVTITVNMGACPLPQPR